MTTLSRAGTGLLLGGGLILATLMIFILAWDGGWAARARSGEAAEVAVFYTDRQDWEDFHRSVIGCVRSGLARLVQDEQDAVMVTTPRNGRLIRFAWRRVGGPIATREEVRRLVARPNPPVAVVGAGNTAQTVALAEGLRDFAGASPGKGPVLLVPMATTVRIDGDGSAAMPLLDVYPGRTFRFCVNNSRLADLVVSCLADREAGSPVGRAILVVDRDDPYSRDLAACFRRVLAGAAPKADVVELSDEHDPSPPPLAGGLPDMPGPAERRLAKAIWRLAGDLPGTRTCWVVLPLQKEPSQRLLAALKIESSRDAEVGVGARRRPVSLRILCGDALGRKTLLEMAGNAPPAFPVWCGASSSATVDPNVSQTASEVVGALLKCLDEPAGRSHDAPTPRDALARLDLTATDPAAQGRSLAFAPSGERRNEDIGHVLEIRPGQSTISAYVKGPKGHWSVAATARPEPAVVGR